MKIIKYTIPPFFILIGFLLYSNVLHGPFLFDDEMYITDNYRIQDMANFLKDFSGTRYIGFLSFALNYYFGDLNTFGYHIVNILIHIINTLLVYFLVQITLYRLKGMGSEYSDRFLNYLAFTVALIFLAHPIQTQSVSYITQRFTSLATLFYLLALLLYAKARVIQIENGKGRRAHFFVLHILSVLSAVLAMKTKEISFTLPFVILLYEITFFRNDGSRIRSRFLYLLPFFLTLFIIPLTFLLTQDIGDIAPAQDVGERIMKLQLVEMKDLSRYTYLLTQFRVIITYIRLLILPINQTFEYDYPLSQSLFEPATLMSGIAVIGALIFTLYLFLYSRRTKHIYGSLISFGILWFFITLSVESSIIPIKDVIFEHRIYLPSIGFILSCAAALWHGFNLLEIKSGRSFKRHLLSVVGVVVIIFAVSTYKRNILWSDRYLMYLDNVEKSPSRAVPHNNLGSAYGKLGRMQDAIEEYQKAISLKPDFAYAYNNLGAAYAKQERLGEAIKEFQIALRLKPDYPETHNNLGIAYAKQGWLDEAVKEFQITLKMKPDYKKAHNNLGLTYTNQGRLNEAIQEFQTTLRLEPDSASTHNNLGLVFEKKGLRDSAIKEFKEALKIKPDFTEARQSLKRLHAKP